MVVFVDKNDVRFTLHANWANMSGKDDLSITLIFKDDRKIVYEFGLCPNDVYGDMIEKMLLKKLNCDTNVDNWIHNILDRF